MKKCRFLDKSLKRFGDKYYRKESFIYVIKVGLSEDIDMALSFADIKKRLIQIYNNAA